MLCHPDIWHHCLNYHIVITNCHILQSAGYFWSRCANCLDGSGQVRLMLSGSFFGVFFLSRKSKDKFNRSSHICISWLQELTCGLQTQSILCRIFYSPNSHASKSLVNQVQSRTLTSFFFFHTHHRKCFLLFNSIDTQSDGYAGFRLIDGLHNPDVTRVGSPS